MKPKFNPMTNTHQHENTRTTRSVDHFRTKFFIYGFLLICFFYGPSSAQGPVANYSFTGDVTDGSSNNLNLIGNTATAATDRYMVPNSSYLFNGSSNKMEAPPSSLLDALDVLTVSCWIKNTGNTGERSIIEKGGLFGEGQYGLWIQDSLPRFCIAGSGIRRCVTASAGIATNNWTHIAGTFNGAILKLFVNGVLSAQENYSGLIDDFPGPLTIGADPANSAWFNGNIDEVKIYSRAISEDEIEDEFSVTRTDTSIVSSNFTYEAISGLNYRFKAASTTNIINYLWSWGDSRDTITNPPLGRNVIHHFPVYGRYNVCLTTLDNSYNRDSYCKTIYAQDLAMGGLTTDTIKFDVGSITHDTVLGQYTVVLNNKMPAALISGTRIWWDYGDGQTDTLPNPDNHIYKRAGIYKITMNVKGRITNITYTYSRFVRVGLKNCRSFFDYATYDLNNSIQFFNKSSKNADRFFWAFGDGGFSTLPAPKHYYPFPGIYNVSLIVVDTVTNCIDFYREKVNAGKVPCSARFDYFVDNATDSVFFSNGAIGNADIIHWVFGDGTVSNNPNPIHKFSKPGIYNVALTVENISKNCIDREEAKVLVRNLEKDVQADFYYKADSLTVKFTELAIGNVKKYIWNFGDTTIAVGNLPEVIHTYQQPGPYNVCLTAINDSNITSTICKKILLSGNILKTCLADFVFTVDSITNRVSFLDKSFDRPVSFVWDFGDSSTGSSFNPKHIYADTGLYKVKLSIVTRNNCKSTKYALVNVHGANRLRAGLVAIADTTKKRKASGYPVDFVGIAHGDAAKLRWSFGDGTVDSTTLNPTHYYPATGNYNACLEIWDQITGEYSIDCDIVQVGTTNINEPDTLLSSSGISLNIYPNPASGATAISFTLQEQSDILLTAFSPDGSVAAVIEKTVLPAGKHLINWRVDGLSGIVIIQLKAGNNILSQKLIIQ